MTPRWAVAPTTSDVARRTPLLLCAFGLMLASCAHAPPDPVVDDSATTRALRKLPRRPGERVPVTIYEFRSEVPGVTGRMATDMFKTALVKSGQFRVFERARLGAGVLREKQMNAKHQTTGDTALSPLKGVRYIFEGAITEANASARTGKTGVDVGGLGLGHASGTDTLGIDVSIVEVDSGEVLDVINVRKALQSRGASASGTRTFGNAVLGAAGKPGSAFIPEVSHESTEKEGVHEALRACIEKAVLELSKRFEG